MSLLGQIVRLQVQQAPLTRGSKPRRWYDPDPIMEVEALTVSRVGAIGRLADGSTQLDSHHVDHPDSRHRGPASALCLGFTSHYEDMRARFGDRVADGVAGENVLVEIDRRVELADLEGGVEARALDGQQARFGEIEVAEPCLWFSRYVVGAEPGAMGGLREPLQALRGGTRGFYLALATPDEITLRVGDALHA